jgi:hypothetical protein
MNRIFHLLRAEQVAILAVIALAVFMGIGWGLPSKQRMDLLLAAGGPTPRQVQLLDSLHILHALGQMPPDSVPRRRGFDGTMDSEIPLALTGTEKLYALREHILASSAVDEERTLIGLGRINPKKLDFNPKVYSYGGSYLYPVGFLYFLMKSAGLLHVSHNFAYYMQNPTQIARMYVAGRLLNLMALIATLILLALLGGMLSGPTAGTFAMLAYGFSTVILNHAIVMKPHVFTAFWIALATWLLVLYVQRRERRLLVLSVLVAGYAVGSSVSAALMGLLYPVLLYERGRESWLVKVCLGAAVTMVAVYFLMNPYTILDWKGYHTAMSAFGVEFRLGFGLWKLPPYVQGLYLNAYTFPVGLFGLVFMLWCAVRRPGPLQRLGLCMVALILFFGTYHDSVRVTQFLGPLIALFAGIAVNDWIVSPLRTRKLLRSALVVLLFLPGALLAGLFARDTIFDEHWYEPTARWVKDAHIGPGTTIGTVTTLDPVDLPPFPFLHAHMVDMSSAAAAADPPQYVLISNYAERYDRLWQDHPLRSRYRLLANLGHRRSYGWLRAVRYMDESRIAAFVYQRADR